MTFKILSCAFPGVCCNPVRYSGEDESGCQKVPAILYTAFTICVHKALKSPTIE